MKSVRMMTAVCMAVILAVQTAITAFAGYSEVLDEMFRQDMSKRGVTAFYDGLEYCGNDGLAYGYALLYGVDGAADYASSAAEYTERLIGSDRFAKPTDLQKAAVTLAIFGECTQELINEAVYLNDDFDRQGFNAYIWGLIALNCTDLQAPANALNTKASLCEYIISKQLEDGGFALKGAAADTDITAAVIYALAPLRDELQVGKALAKAEQCLYSLQLESGGFSSMGIENCDSTAQAIMAAAALGNMEWIEESGVLDVLMSYRCEGGFSHLSGGSANALSSAQVCSVLALYSKLKAEADEIPDNTESILHETEQTPEKSDDTASGDTIKFIIAISFAVAGVTLIVIWISGRKKKSLLFVAAVVCFIAAAATVFVEFRTVDEYYDQIDNTGDIKVTVLADCAAALASPEKAQRELVLPSDGYILNSVEVALQADATVFDALVAAAKQQKLTVEHTVSVTGAYVAGIGVLYEFDYGSESGWLYYINGERPSVSCSEYHLSDGDVVEFVYTCELGR